MRINYNELKKYPNVMNKEQMRTVCHIGKRTALYLLQFGLIPNETTGKLTRCYKIKKTDVIAYMKDREINPGKYLPPKNWYSDSYNYNMFDTETAAMITRVNKAKLKRFYEGSLSLYKDVLDVANVVTFTGYNRRTIGNWIREGKLKALRHNGKYIIPKCYLLEWLCSDGYNAITRKSKIHENTLKKVNLH